MELRRERLRGLASCRVVDLWALRGPEVFVVARSATADDGIWSHIGHTAIGSSVEGAQLAYRPWSVPNDSLQPTTTVGSSERTLAQATRVSLAAVENCLPWGRGPLAQKATDRHRLGFIVERAVANCRGGPLTCSVLVLREISRVQRFRSVRCHPCNELGRRRIAT